jgi:hypothetical protein
MNLVVPVVLWAFSAIFLFAIVFNMRRIDGRILGIVPTHLRRLFTNNGAPSQALRVTIYLVASLIVGSINMLVWLFVNPNLFANPYGHYFEYQRFEFIGLIVLIGISCVAGIIALLSRWQTPIGKVFFAALPFLYAYAWVLQYYANPGSTLYMWLFISLIFAMGALLLVGYRAFIL